MNQKYWGRLKKYKKNIIVIDYIYMKIVKIVKNNKIWILFLFLCIVLGIVYYNTNTIENFTVDEYNYIHKVLLDNLEKTIEIFKNHNIEYWCIAGTLLGCVRESKIIDKDDDIDIAIHDKDYKKLLSYVNNKNSNNKLKTDLNKHNLELIKDWDILKIVSNRKDNNYNVNKIFIDIMSFKLENDKYILTYDSHRNSWPKMWFHKNELYPLANGNLNHLKINIPKNPIKYLERFYDNWKIPDNKESLHESEINLSI